MTESDVFYKYSSVSKFSTCSQYFKTGSNVLEMEKIGKNVQRCQLAELNANFLKTSRMEGQKQKYLKLAEN